MQMFKKLYRDSKGTTLIEIIVSVLIVGIAFVPLMFGLTSALNINRYNENELYAEEVATNVLEVAKSYGQKGLNSLIPTPSTSGGATSGGATSGGATSGGATSGGSTSGGSTSGGATSGETVEVLANIDEIFDGAVLTGGGSSFTITGIKSGTQEYKADISISTWTDKQNDFTGYPSVEGVSGAAFIHYKDESLQYIVEKIGEKSTEGFELPLNRVYETASTWLTRKLEITVENATGTDAADGKKIIVRKKVTYIGTQQTIDGVDLFKTHGDGSISFESQEEVLKYSTIPDSYIVTLKTVKNKGADVILNNDYITVRKSTGGTSKLNVYAMFENGKTLKDKGYIIRFFGTEDLGDVPLPSVDEFTEPTTNDSYSIYAYANVHYYTSGCEALEGFGSGSSGKKSKMKNVTVKVRDESNNIVSEKSSTMIEFE